MYSDLVYRREGDEISTDRAFVRFVTALPPRVDEVVLLGRLDPEPGRAPYVLPANDVRLVPLPFYPSVFHVRRLVSAVRGSARVFADELPGLDAVWLFGPSPLAVLFGLIARRKGVPVLLGVRQDYPRYIAGRLPSRAWKWALGAAWGLEYGFRLLARRAPTIAIGEELARNYRGGAAEVLASGLSLIGTDDLVPLEQALARSWEVDQLRLLSVGRLDPEKNPLLLLEIVAALRKREPRWHLTIVGDGPLRRELDRRVQELGLEEAVELVSYVPNGPRLWEQYRGSHVFLHVSFTEGLPQVLFEAQAAGVPVVATDVGGVAAALGGGATGLLIPPRDANAAVEALERLRTDQTLREGLVEAGLENARRETTQAQLDRIAAFARRTLGIPIQTAG